MTSQCVEHLAAKHEAKGCGMMLVSSETVVTCCNCGNEYAMSYTVQQTDELRLCLDCVEGIEDDLFLA